MNTKWFSAVFFSLLLSSAFAIPGFCAAAESAPEIISLVRDAAALVEQKGEASFAEFRKSGTKWLHDDTYIFVLGDKTELLNPVKPEMENTDVYQLKDADGKPFVRDYADLARQSPAGEAWGHFIWIEPATGKPLWKAAFLKTAKMPAGEEVIVGSGIYAPKMEKEFVVDTVDNAVRLIERKGKDAFAIFNDKTSQYQYQDTYVFVFDKDGLCLAHVNPSMVGSNILDLKDVSGKPLNKEMLEIVQKDGSGWIDYSWPKPGAKEPSKKSSYVKKATLDGKTLVVGAGIYLD